MEGAAWPPTSASVPPGGRARAATPLCVRQLARTEADASGRTGVAALQVGSDTTAPGRGSQDLIISKVSTRLCVNHVMKGILV